MGSNPVISPNQDARFQDDEKLRKLERLRKRPEFLRTQRGGKRRAGAHFIVYARPNDHQWSRLGVTASRKVGKANVRNWWKRRVRDIFRRNKQQIPPGFDFVVIIKASGERDDYPTLRKELLKLFRSGAKAARPR